jgi:hypothetical protein
LGGNPWHWGGQSKDWRGEGNEWMQLEAPKRSTVVGIAIQGRGSNNQWIKKVQIKHSLNDVAFEWVDGGHTFEANSDMHDVVNIMFNTSVTTRFVRILAVEKNNNFAFRAELITLARVPNSMPHSLELYNPDESYRTYSSIHNIHYKFSQVHGNPWHWGNQEKDWRGESHEWIQIDCGKLREVAGVVVQGRGCCQQSVKLVQVKHSVDDNIFHYVDDGHKFVATYYTDISDEPEPKIVEFQSPVYARYIRILSVEKFHQHSMRAGLLLTKSDGIDGLASPLSLRHHTGGSVIPYGASPTPYLERWNPVSSSWELLWSENVEAVEEATGRCGGKFARYTIDSGAPYSESCHLHVDLTVPHKRTRLKIRIGAASCSEDPNGKLWGFDSFRLFLAKKQSSLRTMYATKNTRGFVPVQIMAQGPYTNYRGRTDAFLMTACTTPGSPFKFHTPNCGSSSLEDRELVEQSDGSFSAKVCLQGGGGYCIVAPRQFGTKKATVALQIELEDVPAGPFRSTGTKPVDSPDELHGVACCDYSPPATQQERTCTLATLFNAAAICYKRALSLCRSYEDLRSKTRTQCGGTSQTFWVNNDFYFPLGTTTHHNFNAYDSTEGPTRILSDRFPVAGGGINFANGHIVEDGGSVRFNRKLKNGYAMIKVNGIDVVTENDLSSSSVCHFVIVAISANTGNVFSTRIVNGHSIHNSASRTAAQVQLREAVEAVPMGHYMLLTKSGNCTNGANILGSVLMETIEMGRAKLLFRGNQNVRQGYLFVGRKGSAWMKPRSAVLLNGGFESYRPPQLVSNFFLDHRVDKSSFSGHLNADYETCVPVSIDVPITDISKDNQATVTFGDPHLFVAGDEIRFEFTDDHHKMLLDGIISKGQAYTVLAVVDNLNIVVNVNTSGLCETEYRQTQCGNPGHCPAARQEASESKAQSGIKAGQKMGARCCAPDGTKLTMSTYGAGNGCSGEVNYAEALAFCASYAYGDSTLEVCQTLSELAKLQGTGCGYDHWPLWVQTQFNPSCSIGVGISAKRTMGSNVCDLGTGHGKINGKPWCATSAHMDFAGGYSVYNPPDLSPYNKAGAMRTYSSVHDENHATGALDSHQGWSAQRSLAPHRVTLELPPSSYAVAVVTQGRKNANQW